MDPLHCGFSCPRVRISSSGDFPLLLIPPQERRDEAMLAALKAILQLLLLRKLPKSLSLFRSYPPAAYSLAPQSNVAYKIAISFSLSRC